MTARTASTKSTAQARAARKAVNGADDIIIDAPVKNEPKPASQETQYAFDSYCDSLGVRRRANDRPIKSAKHAVAGFLGSIAAMMLGYAIGMQIADYLAMGVFWLTGWGYLALAVWIIGVIISLLAAMYTGGKIARYIATGQYSDDMERAWGWVTGKMSGFSTFAKRSAAEATVH